MTTPSQTELWNGASGRRWVEHQAALDVALEPFGAHALERARIEPGHRVLDVGTGCGATAIALAKLVGGSGHVRGLDISHPMLELARQRAAAVEHIELLEGDAQRFTFEKHFDVVYSRFGVMFFDDLLAAFRNLRSALVAHGRLVFVSWRRLEDNPWLHVPLDIARAAWPQMPPLANDGPGPLALADRERVVDILSGAGFAQIGIERFDAHVSFGESLDEAVEFAILAGPLARLLVDASASIRARVRQELQQSLRERRTADSFGLPGSAWMVTATER